MSRMRKKKNLDARMERCAALLVTEPEQLRGVWVKSMMPEAAGLQLELGCGKGRFTAETAARNPDVLFVAIERVADALVMAMERCLDMGLKNVCFICDDAVHLKDFFEQDEVSRIYINFCDPWPAKRHAKRRLIHEDFLREYREILPDQGEIHFKTDNRPLFDFALTQFPRAGFRPKDITYDLHQAEPYTIMTDFEVGFYQEGTKISRCTAVKELRPLVTDEALPAQSLLDYWQEGDPVPRGMDEQALHQRAKERGMPDGASC